MAFSSATVSVGGVTRQSEYQRVLDNTIYIRDSLGTMPIGAVIAYPINTPPVSFLKCDGASYLRSEYSDLFDVIGTEYGAADGTHFNVPDYRGLFLRGAGAHGTLNMADGNDVDGGSVADENVDQMFGHKHELANAVSVTRQTGTGGVDGNAGSGIATSLVVGDPTDDGTNGTPNTGAENYPSHGVTTWIIRATNTSVTLEAVTSATIADLIVTNSITVNGSHPDLLGTDYTVLADYPTRKYNGTITLSEALTNFEYLVVKAQYYTGTNVLGFVYYPTSLISLGDTLEFWHNDVGRAHWVYTNSTTLTFESENNSWIRTVYGMGRKA